MALYRLKAKKTFAGIPEKRKIEVGEIIETTSEERLQRILSFNLADLIETRIDEDDTKDIKLEDMSYKQLQNLAKEKDIPANQKRTELIEALSK